MDQFNIRQKDVYKFDDFMDLKKPAFGGPNSAIAFDPKKEPKQLASWRRVVSRNKDFENGHFSPVYNGTWRAVAADRATRDSGKKQQVDSDIIDDLLTGRALPSLEKFTAVKENMHA